MRVGFENLDKTPIRTLQGPYGDVRISPVEELIVERVLIGHQTGEYPPAIASAKKLIAAALLGEVETDWPEVRRLVQGNAYQNWGHVKALIDEQAKALQVRSPADSDE